MFTLAPLAQEQVPDLPAYGFTNNWGSMASLAVTVLLPLLVGLVTTRATHPGWKAVLLLLLAAINSIITAWLQARNTGATFEWIPVAFTWVVNFLIAVAVHFGLWRPIGASAATQDMVVTDRKL